MDGGASCRAEYPAGVLFNAFMLGDALEI